MAAIGVLDELRFAKARFPLEQELANLWAAVHQDIGRAPDVESNDIAVALAQAREESERVRAAVLVVEFPQLLALGARR
jgi:hypothetical protein